VRFRFEEFELDTDAFELRRAGESVRLEPQVFGVLACLVGRHERLVSRDELLDEVWGTRFVSDATVASRVKAARRAIGDDGTAQRLIRTVTGRGYRFVGGVETVDHGPPARESLAPCPVELVGREGQLSVLGEQRRAAESGSARVVLVTGEAGSGKTALVDLFRAGLGVGWCVWIGHCLPLSAGADPYGPFLEALSSAMKADPAVVDALAAHAPTWLVQLPVPLGPETADALASRALGATQGRIVREFVGAVEALSERRPVVLVLEDLHWADEPSLRLVEAIARMRAGARLLVIGTLRRGEGRVAGESFDGVVEELALRDLVVQVPATSLSEAEVGAYVRGRFEAETIPGWLPALVVERTGGNPLFVRCLLDSWLHEGRVVAEAGVLAVSPRDELARDVPPTIRRLIETEIARCGREERRVLEAASVAGVQFSAAEVAACTARSLDEVDVVLTSLAAEGGVLRRRQESAWPDGTRCGGYLFAHELYRDGVYQRVPPSRRGELHGFIGRRLELAYGEASEQFFAAQLAHHFVEAGDARRAVKYLRAAASQSLARSAHAEAARQAEQALALVASLSDPAEAAEREIGLRSILAVAHAALHGWGSSEIETSYRRARELADATGADAGLPAVVYGLATLHEYRGEYERSEALMTEHLDQGPNALVPEALELLACSTFHQGRFVPSLEFAERALTAYDQSLTSAYLARYGESPAVNYHCWAALSLWFLGREADSLAEIGAALEAADEHAYSLTTALAQAAFLHQFRRDPTEARRWAEETIEIAAEHDFPFRIAQGTIVRGWTLAALGDLERGADELAHGLELYRATGAGMDVPYYLGLCAEVALWRSRSDEALELLAQARELLPQRGFFYEAQLLALEAQIRAESSAREAAALLEQAHAVAAAQGASRVAADISAALERVRSGAPVPLDEAMGMSG
jgi:DNA-binding winged helix-turn-helix (wHTH) protein/predicted ATPase